MNNAVKNPFVIPGIKKMQIDPQLNPNYTFDAYIEGDCNRVARRAGKTVADKPGANSFNPVRYLLIPFLSIRAKDSSWNTPSNKDSPYLSRPRLLILGSK